jgi:tetratricopeptide (TPR) repeat protein
MKEAKNQDSAPQPRSLTLLVLLLLLVLSFAIGFFKLSSHDTFWHLKTGQYILSHGIPSVDPFSFTAAGRHWVTHEWLAEVLLYVIYAIGGVFGLMLFKGIMSASIAFLIFRFGTRRNVSASFSAAAAMFAVAAMSYMMYARPHAFTFLFLAILCMVLFGDSVDFRRQKVLRWAVIPAIFLLWANMHAGFLLGLALYWVVVAKESFMAPAISFGERVKIILLPAIFATLIGLINPSGYEVFYYPIMISMTPIFKSSIAEWVSPIYLGRNEWLALGILGLGSAAGLAAAVVHIRKRPDISLILIAIGVSAWTAMRNIQNFAVVLAFGILAIPAVRPEIRLPKRFRWLSSTIAIAWMFLLFGLIRNYQAENGRTGFGIKAGLVAEGPCEFLRKAGFKGNIINALHDGAYLIWKGYPDWKVFIDGRLDVYGPEFLENYRRIIEGAPGAMTALERYGVDVAVLDMPPNIGALRNQLSGNSSWPLVYYDDYYLVYLKNNDANRQLVETSAFRLVNPLSSGFGLLRQDDIEPFYVESIRGLNANPNSSLANAVYAYALQNMGEYIAAAQAYKRAMEIMPHKTNMIRSVANMYMQANQNDSARVWYERAIKANPNDPQMYYELGFLYARMNDLENAERYFKKSDSINPSGPAKSMLERISIIKTKGGPNSGK